MTIYKCPKCMKNPKVIDGIQIDLMMKDLQTVSKSGKTFYDYFVCRHCSTIYRRARKIEILRPAGKRPIRYLLYERLKP